ncbi:hypothetical protein [Desulforhopalus vacuolatus]|nr:hypothetical protein [Desulforhopalus vacuolatus]
MKSTFTLFAWECACFSVANTFSAADFSWQVINICTTGDTTMTVS